MPDVMCTVCGNTIPSSDGKKIGRPKQFHDECRELNNAFSLIQNRLEVFKTKMNPTREKKNRVRSTLWSMANGMNGK